MARLRGEIKRGFLRSLWRACPDGVSLDEMLGAFQDSGFSWVKTGRVVVSTAGGGYSTSFNATQPVTELSQEEVFALSEEFFAVRDEVLATLKAAGAATDDESLVAAMLLSDRMAGARQEMNDYTGLRFGYGTNFAV